MAAARLASVSLDCVDPLVLGTFWAELLGGTIVFSSDEFVAVETEGIYVAAVAIATHIAPTWPNGPRPKQLHLDLAVNDLDESQAEAIRLGATLHHEQPAPERWRVLLDPAGHPFCLSVQIPDIAGTP